MNRTNRKRLLTLFAVYAALCLIRFLLALASSAYPTTIPDEFLYYSVARSLAGGEGALFYGQQADYSFCLYPLLLSTAYLFPDGTNFYRVMQIISILVMNLSLFPLYGLGKAVLKDEKKSLEVSVIALLLPDFILGQGVLSESLIYPLFYLALWLAYSGELRRLALAGFIGGLLFAVKPGQIIGPAVLIAVTAVSSLKTEPKKGALQLAAGFVPMAISAAVMLLLSMKVLNPGTTVFSVYDQQIAFDDSSRIGAFLKGAALSPYTFITAAGIFPVLLPLFRMKDYSPGQKNLLYSALISAAVLMVGTAWVVNRVEYPDPTVHTRYIAMLFPIFLMLLFAVPDRPASGKAGGAASFPAVGFAVFAVLCIAPLLVFRYDGGIKANASIIFNYALCLLRSISGASPKSIVLTVLIAAALCGAFFLCRTNRTARLKKAAVALFAAFALINNLCAYICLNKDIAVADTVERGTAEILSAIGGENYLDVIGDSRTRYDALLDVNTKDSKKIVYINDLFNRSVETGGVYEPFVPDVLRGDIPDRPTDETELVLLDRDALTHVGLADTASVVRQTDYLTLVRITPGERWLDSMLGGPVGSTLPAETTAYFVNFDGKTYSSLSVDMTISSDASVIISPESLGSYSFDLPQGRDTYKISLNGDQMIALSGSSDIQIHSYSFVE